MKRFCVCSCYYSKNIFLKKYDLHITYNNPDSFLMEYAQTLKQRGCKDLDEVMQDIDQQVINRKLRFKHLQENQELIRNRYQPLHAAIYNLNESFLDSRFVEVFQDIEKGIPPKSSYFKKHGDCIYSFPVFKPEFCDLFMEEVKNFERSDFPKTRPNTMNNYGVIMEELGMAEFMTSLRTKYIFPIASHYYPDWTGQDLDSHKAFIVVYKMGEDEELSYHYDNAEITLNVSLTDEHSDGELYFGPMRGHSSERRIGYEHKKGYGVLHRGQHMHGAWPISEGERYNLIIWCRSSSIRNLHCPMCDEVPDKIPVTHSSGDGFTEEVINGCSLT